MAKTKLDFDYVPPVPLDAARALRALSEGTAEAHQQRKVFDWLLGDVCGLKAPTFRAGQPDATAFLEGRRFVGLFLAAVLTRNINTPKGDTNG